MKFDKCDWRDNEEELSNGVYIWRYLQFNDPKVSETPWMAAINIGGWHYSQLGVTKEEAIQNLYSYINKCKDGFVNHIKIIEERIKAVDEFLQSLPVEYRECIWCNGTGIRKTGYVKCDLYGVHDTRKSGVCNVCNGSGKLKNETV